jgi:peptide/nickel transport system substrate-binding protein
VDGGDSLVERIDPASGAVTRTVAVGSDPTSIAATPDGTALWVVNTGSGTVFRIEAETATVTAAQQVGDRPTGIVVEQDAVWVAVSSTNEILRLDPDSAQIVGRTALQATPQAVTDEGGHVAFTADAPAGTHRGGTLRVVTSAGNLPALPDPTYWQWGLDWTPQTTNDPLVTYKRVGGPDALTFVPDLAEYIPDSPDGGLTWTFRLRAGLRYSDGRTVRAGDALGSFERGVIAGSVTQAGMFGNTEIVGSSVCGARPPCDLSRGITTDDAARTISFHLIAADPDFPNRLFGVPILPSDTPLAAVHAPVPATGPYEVASFVPGRSVRLVRNPLFQAWSNDAQPDGNADEIDITVSTSPDPSAEVESGAADVLQIETEAAARLAQLRTTVPGELHVAPPLATWLEFMNPSRPPFDDIRVRDAINLATDRAALVDTWGGPLTATVTCQLLPPGFAGYERYCPWTVDPGANGNWLGPDLGRARALIDQAGVRGSAVTVLGADDGGQHAAMARSFADLLDSLGFRATTRLMSFDDYFTFLGEHPDQVQMAGYWVRDEDRTPATLIVGGFSCPSFQTAIERNPVGWCSQALDARMTTALGLGDTDPVGADEQWAAIDHAIVDASPAVMPFNTTDVTLLSNRVGGFEDNPVMLLYDQLWVR